MSNLKNRYKSEIIKKMRKSNNYSNDFQVPKITKVTVNTGTGKIKDTEEFKKTIISDLAAITGQKPKWNIAKKSISGFKLRAGEVVGFSVILRGVRMYDFIEKLISVVLPGVRDFRGLSLSSFDKEGNYSIGVKEHVMFPEIKFDQVKENYGLQINISTTGKNQKEGKELLEKFGFPFVKNSKEK